MDPKLHAENIIFNSVGVLLDLKQQAEQIAKAAQYIGDSLASGRHVLSCGNGGSAADAQHLTAEIVGRFKREREGLPAICLNSDTAVITSIANDFGYQQVFSRQVTALGGYKGILIAISTSGNSENVVDAVHVAKSMGMRVIALTGGDGGDLHRALSRRDVEIRAASEETARIQEVHGVIIHVLCELLDEVAS